MTKIYEALEHAKNTKQSSSDKIQHSDFKKVSYDFPSVSFKTELEEPIKTLYQNIITLLPDSQHCRNIQFTSARPDEGVSLIIREFSRLCALVYNKKVLLLDIGPKHDNQMSFFKVSTDDRWRDFSNQQKIIEGTIRQVETTNLYVGSMISQGTKNDLDIDSQELSIIFENLENEFDFILIDSLNILIKRVDGFLIIVEAEKTRWQVVEDLKNKIINQGNKVLGVFLNKRTFPIPKFIYNYL